MKINWGYKIALLYLGFVALIVSMVIMAMRQKVDLVAKNYYEQEIAYQKKIDKQNLSSALSVPLSWELKNNELSFKFPSQFKGKNIVSEIYFFRPSDERMDKIFTRSDSSLNQNIPTNNLAKGIYKMQINWKVNNGEYYNEGIINIK